MKKRKDNKNKGTDKFMRHFCINKIWKITILSNLVMKLTNSFDKRATPQNELRVDSKQNDVSLNQTMTDMSKFGNYIKFNDLYLRCQRNDRSFKPVRKKTLKQTIQIQPL